MLEGHWQAPQPSSCALCLVYTGPRRIYRLDDHSMSEVLSHVDSPAALRNWTQTCKWAKDRAEDHYTWHMWLLRQMPDNALSVAALHKRDEELFLMLLSPPSFHQLPTSVAQAMQCACKVGYTRAVERLLRAPGINVNSDDEDGRTPLHYATGGGHQGVVEQLLRAPGIDVNAVDAHGGLTPLHCAAGGGHQGVVWQLLRALGIDVK